MDNNVNEEWWMDRLRMIREENGTLWMDGNENWIQNMSNENWEQLGGAISNNTHLTTLDIYNGALNDHKMSFLFRGLTRSNSIIKMDLADNGFSVAGVRSMVPFLQNTNNLTYLRLDGSNNIQSEGFNLLLRALHNIPIERLNCQSCGIESVEIDSEHMPSHLKMLLLFDNSINSDGCRELAKLLQGADAKLEFLALPGNMIDDEGVGVLVDALQSNTSLRELYLQENDGISKQGKIMLLKLVNDVSSISATLQSNHTLRRMLFDTDVTRSLEHINTALEINCLPGEAGRKKVIKTQLNSVKRAELAELQGVTSSVFSEIDPLHLPEVLALVGNHNGQGEFYAALRSSIAGVISTVNRKQCLKQQIAEKRAKIVEFQSDIEAAEAEIDAIEAAEVHVMDAVSASRSNKRRRS